jgi:carboxyl-terminal processing protease
VKKDGPYSNFKWVLMVNNKSASATEVIAGVLKRQGAVIMGEPTYGKGTVQERWILFDVGDKRCPGLLKLTARQIFFDDGTSPEGTGIKPDIVVTDSENALLKPIEYLSRQMAK